LWDEVKGARYVRQNINGRIAELYKYAGRESIIEQCEKSLKRLNTDYIDLYLIHWPDVTTPIEESMEAMNLLVKQGKIRAVGLCNHSADLIARASAVCPIAAIKDRYSMLYRAIENELVSHCVENNIGIMCYSVLQRGLLENTLLDGKEVRFTAWPRGDNRKELALFDPGNIELIRTFLQNINEIAKDNGVTVAQLAIRWLLDQPGISVALLTAKDRQQLEHDVRVLDLNLSIGDKTAVSDLLQELEENLAFANLWQPLEDKIAKFCTI
jgi:aryl-alcohol dehydrogenase-like predicted oxidoreductase